MDTRSNCGQQGETSYRYLDYYESTIDSVYLKNFDGSLGSGKSFNHLWGFLDPADEQLVD